ncbi:MAG: hypothetical protein AAB487_03175 [Patescibacteria group bacterium]
MDILYLFHHIHHKGEGHAVHHCGGEHKKIDIAVDYLIQHCSCGKHSIDKEFAIGHGTNENLDTAKVRIKFLEKCPDDGWHIESGVKAQA